MSETPETRAATTNVAAAPEPAPASAPAPPGRAPAGGPAPVSPRRGRRLLLILFVVRTAVAVAAAAVTVVLVTQGPRQTHVAAHPLRATVFRLHPGQCFNSLPNGIAGAHAVPCRQPHDGEIYGEFRVAGQSWPGAAALGEQARQGCQSRLGGCPRPPRRTRGGGQSHTPPQTRVRGKRACVR